MIFGERLSELRKDRNLRQRDLAKLLGVSVSTVSLYERGKVSPPDDIKIKLTTYFNVSMDYLMGLSDIANHGDKRYFFFPDSVDDDTVLKVKEYTGYLMTSKKKNE